MPRPITKKIRESIATGYKTCIACNKHMPHEMFPKHKAMKDGRRSTCCKCKYAQDKKNNNYKRKVVWNEKIKNS